VFPWTGKDLDQFESDWSYKPVSVTGVYDHSKEYKLETMFRGEKGV
jgi:cytochrome oxidase assembly protein ShyY1